MICVSCDASLEDTPATCPTCGSDPRLDGRYRLERRIGRGANGTVYQAIDQETGAAIAVKELPLRHDLDPKQQELFRREAAILQQLSHPAIPRALGQVIAGRGKARALYLLQALVPGRTLSAEMDAHRYTEAEVIAIVIEVVEILRYLHGLSPPVIHRDIKPSNLMRRPDRRLVLIDFGTVRDAIRDPALGGSTVAGTFGYMAPEQFSGEAGPATDYYGLGVTALALLARRDPATLFDRTGQLNWSDAIQASAKMRRLLSGLLEPDPDRRITTPGAVSDALAEHSPPVPQPQPAGLRASDVMGGLLIIALPLILSLPIGLIMIYQLITGN